MISSTGGKSLATENRRVINADFPVMSSAQAKSAASDHAGVGK